MPSVKCSVDGCSRRLQPILKVEPRDRDTWLYRECDVCFRPVCEEHSSEAGGEIRVRAARNDTSTNYRKLRAASNASAPAARRESSSPKRSAGITDDHVPL